MCCNGSLAALTPLWTTTLLRRNCTMPRGSFRASHVVTNGEKRPPISTTAPPSVWFGTEIYEGEQVKLSAGFAQNVVVIQK